MAEQPQTGSRPDDGEAIEELDALPSRSFYDKVHDLAERFVTTRVGQFVAERADRALKVVEETAKWSVPQAADKPDEAKLVRPLPWAPFIALIIAVRLVRVWLSVVALLIGNGPVTAHDVVYFIQTRRRKLRAIRMHGLKEMHARRSEAPTQPQSRIGGTSIGFVGTLRVWLSSALCQPGQTSEPARRIFVYRDGQAAPSDMPAPAERQTEKRRRDDECAQDLALTCDQLLSKYAEENSDDDSDFVPHPDEVDGDDDDASTSCGSDSSSQHDEDEGTAAAATEPTNGQSLTNGEPRTDGGNSLDKSIVEVDASDGPPQKSAMHKPLLEIKKEPVTDNDSGNEQPSTPMLLNRPRNGAPEVATRPNATAAAAAPKQPNSGLQLLCNGTDSDYERKSTPGHVSAARAAVVTTPAFGATATADSRAATIATSPSSTSASTSSSPSTSFSSLDSRVPSDDDLFPGRKQNNATPLTTTSSSEDLFYSPIGSPTDFNSCIRPVSILKKNHLTAPLYTSDAQSMSKTADERNEASGGPDDSTAPKKHVHHQPTTTSAKQNHYQNRYRGKNRR